MNFKRLDHFLSSFSQDVGIDLGTANSPIKIRGQSAIISEPSYVTLDNNRLRVVAVGHESKMMEGKTPPNLSVVRPVRDGVIAEFDIASELMKYLMRRVNTQGVLRPRVIVGVPSETTEVERRAVAEATRMAGARVVYLIDQPVAAAIGADLEVLKPQGNLVLDIGGGTSELAMISLGGVVICECLKIAGDKMDEAIVNYVRQKYDLIIGERSAEEIKIQIGTVIPNGEIELSTVKGRDMKTGLPRRVELSNHEIAEALAPIIAKLLDMIKRAMENIPPELVSDIFLQGIVLTGGGALLRGLDQLLTRALGVKCYTAEQPLLSVVIGQEKIFQNRDLMRKIPLERF